MAYWNHLTGRRTSDERPRDPPIVILTPLPVAYGGRFHVCACGQPTRTQAPIPLCQTCAEDYFVELVHTGAAMARAARVEAAKEAALDHAWAARPRSNTPGP